jgi:hypothetical protein
MIMGASSIAVVVEVKVGGFAFGIVPTKDQPPLAIYSDGMIVRQFALQGFEMVAGRYAQIVAACGIVDQLQFAKQPGVNIGRDFLSRLIEDVKVFKPFVPKTSNHPTFSFTCEPMYHSMGQLSMVITGIYAMCASYSFSG